MRAVIYLDFDGVLLPLGGSALDEDGLPVGPREPIEAFNELVRSLDCVVVVISTWRVGRTLGELQDLLSRWGVEGNVVGSTPVLDDRLREIEADVQARHGLRIVVIDDMHLDPPDEWYVLRPAAHLGLRRDDVRELQSRLGINPE